MTRSVRWVVVVVLLTSCATLHTLYPQNPLLATYDEPKTGARARVRLSGLARNPIVYPGTACDRGVYPGAGKPGGPRLGGGYAARDLGMPKFSDAAGKLLEIYVRAGEPVTMAFDNAEERRCPPALPGHRAICNPPPLCTVRQTFVPEANTDYEVLFTLSHCRADVFAVVPNADRSYRKQPVTSQVAGRCSSEPSPASPNR